MRKPQHTPAESESTRLTSSFFRQAAEPAAQEDVDQTENWAELVPQDSPAGIEELMDEPTAETAEEPAYAEEAGYVAPDDATPEAETDAPRSTATPIGMVVLVLGVGLGAASATLTGPTAEILARLAAAGLGASTLLLCGLALIAVGSIKNSLARTSAAQARRNAALERRLRQSISDQPRETAVQGTSSDFPALKVEFDRLDEKIANLTRATKLYGTPLLEISNQVAELSNRLQDVGDIDQRFQSVVAQLNSAEAISREDLSPVMRAIEAVRDKTVEVLTSLRQSAKEVIESVGKSGESLREGIRQTGSAVEDCQLEVLQSLRNTQEESRRTVTDAAERVVHAVEQRASEHKQTVTQGHTTLHQIEATLSRVQTEVQGLATSVARLGARAPAAHAHAEPRAHEPAPQAAAPQAPAQTAPQGATPAAGGDDVPAKIAGSRQAPTKNVLGAIAKLRSMRN